MSTLFLVLAIISVLWGVVSSLVIINYLQKNGVKINFLLLKLYIISYVNQYKKMTTEQTGKPGVWFYSYIGSMCMALAFAIIGLFLRS